MFIVCTYMCAWYVSFTVHMHEYIMEVENSITLTIYTSVNIFIVLGWRSEMIMVFMNILTRTIRNQDYDY